MNRRILLLLSFFVLFPTAGSLARAQTAAPSSSFVDPQAAEKANAHEDELYNNGTQALNNGAYDEAAGTFDQVVKMRGRRAAAAMYWKAYALAKAGNKGQALTTIAELKKAYPQSRYVDDAGALEVELRGASASPENVNTDEEKLLALNTVMQNDPEKGLAFAEKWIRTTTSSKVKERILFILSQSNSDKAQQVLLSIAKANNDPDLQRRAIRNLGMNPNSRNRAALKEIYNSASDPSVKKAVFQGWLMSGDKEDVLAVAKQEKSPELRRDAIRYLGMMGGREELRQIYREAGDAETKEAVLTGMMMCGDAQGVAEIANTERDPNVVDKAINTLGLVGGSESLTTLINIYNSHAEIQTKKHVINALFLHNAGKEMVELARKETNPELKRDLVQKMSLMHSPEITNYMMEILNK